MLEGHSPTLMLVLFIIKNFKKEGLKNKKLFRLKLFIYIEGR